MGLPRTTFFSVVALSGIVVTSGSPASAQPQSAPAARAQATPPPAVPSKSAPGATGTGGSAKPGDASDPVERARVHYERGLQLFNEENYTAALFEFERAYELAPSYRILYNMGRIQRQQNNYAAAMRSYERYLREGGEAVPADRRKEVEGELGILAPRVARVTVKVNVDGADVYSDDSPVCTATIESSCVGKSPLLAPIVLNGGRHKITATKPGYAPATSLVSVVGSDAVDVTLTLVSYDRPQAPPPNAWITPAIVGWSVTGVAAITTGVLGGLSISAKNKQQSLLADPTATQDSLKAARDKTQNLSGATDALLISTVVFAGISTYFTIRMIGAKHKERDMAPPAATASVARPTTVDLKFSPTGFAAVGTF